jgi:hypothetical protein
MKSLNLVNTIAEYNELKSNYDSIDPYVCYVQDEKEVMYDGVPSTWQIRYTSSDGNIVKPRSNKFGGVNIVDNIYRNGEGIIVFDGEVKIIEDTAFWFNKKLTEIKLPTSIRSICNVAFSHCTLLTEIKNLDNVINVGYNAFANTKWIEDQTDEYIYIGKCLYKCKSEIADTNIELRYDTVQICAEAFINCTNIKSVSIPDSVTYIGQDAFNNCSSLTSVEIPNSVTDTGVSVFNGCTSLVEVILSNNIK